MDSFRYCQGGSDLSVTVSPVTEMGDYDNVIMSDLPKVDFPL